MELGLITENESKLLAQFREQIQDLQIPKELQASKNLVRWLRARENKLADAESMFRAHLKWRSEINVEKLKDFHLSPEWDEYFHSTLYSINPDGFPVFIIKIKTWDYEKGVKAGLKDELTRFGSALLERSWMHCLENSKDKKYIPKFINITDMSGLSLSQISSTAAVRVMMDIIRAYEANYPESLGTALILNAPWVFQVVWKILTPILSAKTTAKLQFLGSDAGVWRTEISKIVPLEKFPNMYGGDGENSAALIPRL